MRNFLHQYGLLSGLVLLFIAIFAIGGMYSRFMTEQIEVREEERQQQEVTAQYLATCQTLFGETIEISLFTPSALTKSYTLPENRGEFTPTIQTAIKVYEGDAEIGVVYYVNSYGKDNLVLAFGFDVTDQSTKGVVVISQKETPQYYGKLTTAFFDQFETAHLDDLGFGVDGIAGATLSSKGFEIGWLYAREVYALDYDFTIPTIDMNLLEVRYNFDLDTFIASPYIADITYGESDTPASVYLSPTFEYVGLVGGGADLDADLQTAVGSFAAQNSTLSTKASFISYDAGTRVLVMRAKGYNSSNPIQITITLNETLDGIVSYSVVSEESYDEDENHEYGTYVGGPVPEVENTFMNQYLADGTTADAVAGASQGTSPAMAALIALLDGFIDAQNGGN
jgi:hypothetical protein